MAGVEIHLLLLVHGHHRYDLSAPLADLGWPLLLVILLLVIIVIIVIILIVILVVVIPIAIKDTKMIQILA